jgi:hypothetical protein
VAEEVIRSIANVKPFYKAATYADYERVKKAWLHQHPTATPLEIARACRQIAKDMGL